MKVNRACSDQETKEEACEWVMNKAHYCPDTYLIMLAVRRLLTIMFTQSTCIGRLQVEKCVCLLVQAQNDQEIKEEGCKWMSNE